MSWLFLALLLLAHVETARRYLAQARGKGPLVLVGLAVLLIVVAVLSFPVVWTVASVLASGPSIQTNLDRSLLLASAFTSAPSVLTSLYLGLLAARSRG